MAVVSLGPLAAPAQAAPSNPSDADLSAAQSSQEQAAAEVGRLAGLLSGAESDLEQVMVQAEAISEADRIAQGELEAAEEQAVVTATELQAAQQAVTVARADVATVGRERYMASGDLSGIAALISAAGPDELLEGAATLRLLADQRTATLEGLRVAEAAHADADARAKTAVADRAQAAEQATAAKVAADEQVAVFQAATDALAAQRATIETQLQEAQVRLLSLQGQRNAYQAWQQQQAREKAEADAQAAAAAKAAAQAAAAARAAAQTTPPVKTATQPASPVKAGSPATPPATGGKQSPAPDVVGAPAPRPVSGGGAAPTSGRFTTCFEMRWGVMHNGVDIAAPIGTPIYAPAAGKVVRVGEASGYGLAVYLQHDDGSVSVYGHINDYFVSAGQRVSAGTVIAEVGNKGQSTGPHLHFQVNTAGLHAGAVDPISWLADRGVSMGGRC
ncbi:peptidoglycan DD-metalloendopeptidase family protein [Modestobacter muralis]|uniref:Peptidoglycan DD-metalloendopeptidase family protein n=1 Tax=Modestobacter muralis TaxID=1608614 RepID=A0A6P0HCT9_9ACTN|nr:peptidoglycan DD-metalloendopeptidase family protein [Modestobacter muralis]NEN53410.1 peptidoglycan DD-metalloendopeptidase family protein [Modestobacter muralis]